MNRTSDMYTLWYALVVLVPMKFNLVAMVTYVDVLPYHGVKDIDIPTPTPIPDSLLVTPGLT